MEQRDSKRPARIWHKVTVSVARNDAEERGADSEKTGLSPMDAFVGAVQSLHCCGIETKDEEEIGDGLGEKSQSRTSEREQVDAYFDDAIDPADLQKHLELIAELISAAGSSAASGSAAGGRKLQVGMVEEVPEEDWAEEWRRNWKPMRVTKNILICPSWLRRRKAKGEREKGTEPGAELRATSRESGVEGLRISDCGFRIAEKEKRRKTGGIGGSDTPERTSQTVIYIYPRMAFGTGSHATTQICLKLLERYMMRGARVIDIGAGSAILSIGAAKLGARSVVAVEMDEVAVENALENCKFNRVLSKVKIVCDRFGPSLRGRFTLGVCNMLGHEMLPLLPDITHLLDGKALIVSGLTRASAVDVRWEMARLGWRIQKTLRRGEWVGFYATHVQSPKFEV